MKKLILTGWSVGYAVPAMIALTKFPDSIVKGVSKRRLPELLAELAETNGSLPQEVVILGVALSGNPHLLSKAVRILKKRGVRVVWISVYSVPNSLGVNLQGLFSETIIDENADFCDLISDYFQVRKNFADVTRLKRLYRPSNKLDPSEKWAVALIEAASFRYRTVQDDLSFSNALKTVAGKKPLSDKQHAIIKEFEQFSYRELKGNSEWTKETRKLVRRVGEESRCRVLITGETGTGKETIATLIHRYSDRSCNPFIAFNCADLSPQMLESRLFGHEKGSFTGAEKQRQGAFELADEGTLFLDEVAELSLNAQAGLLRALQENRFFRLGGEEEVSVNVRILAATNRNLPQMVKDGAFREDLFYRLNTINIHVPPLRERLEDLSSIAKDYLIRMNYRQLKPSQLEQLESYSWPGNVRELQNILDRANILDIHDYNKLIREHKLMLEDPTELPDDRLETAKRYHVKRIYEKCDGNKSKAAGVLEISDNTFKKYLN